MMTKSQIENISFFPFKKEINSYSWGFFRDDISAGFALAFLTLPQAMAYALLAGLPIWCGLFASIYSAAVVSLFGSSKHLMTGPSTAMAILIQTGISEVLFTFYREVSGPEKDALILQILSQITLLVSLFQLLAASFKLGHLTQFVSHSVVLGYLAGTALAMVVNQLFPFLGIEGISLMASFFERVWYLVGHLSSLHWPTALVGILTWVLIYFTSQLDKRFPSAVIGLLFSTLLVFGIHVFVEPDSWYRISLVGDRGSLSKIIPTFSLPYFDFQIVNELLPVAFAISLLSILEGSSVAKSIAASSGQRLSINQEIFGLSLGNALSSLMGSMPVSGNSSRSMTNYMMGGKTRFSSVFNALFTLTILFLLEFLVVQIPVAAMAALLLNAAPNIINRNQLVLCLKATGSDALVFWITFLACILFSLDIAFYIGIVLSIILYLKKAAVPRFVECSVTESGELRKYDPLKIQEKKQIRLIKVEGELFFGAADLFQTSLKTIMEGDTSAKVILLQLRRARDIDATSCLALQQLHSFLKKTGRSLVACGITWSTWEVLSHSGVIDTIGKENLFIFDERNPKLHLKKALQRAKFLVEKSF